MVWIFDQRKDSPEVGNDSATLKCVAGRTGDGAYVRNYALAATPLIYLRMYRQSVQCSHIGGGMWNIDVEYGPREPEQLNDYSIQFEVRLFEKIVWLPGETIDQSAVWQAGLLTPVRTIELLSRQ